MTPLLVVDVQPAYMAYCLQAGLDIARWMRLNPDTPVLWYYNDIGDQEESALIEYMGMLGIRQTPRLKIVPKYYGFFRDWMDSGVDDETIIEVGVQLATSGLHDSEYLSMEAYSADLSDLGGIVLPSFDTSVLLSPEKWMTAGGGKDECLKEMELLLSIHGIGYEQTAMIY